MRSEVGKTHQREGTNYKIKEITPHRDLFSLESSASKQKIVPGPNQELGLEKRIEHQTSNVRGPQETVEDMESAGSLELSQEIEILERIKSSRERQEKKEPCEEVNINVEESPCKKRKVGSFGPSAIQAEKDGFSLQADALALVPYTGTIEEDQKEAE